MRTGTISHDDMKIRIEYYVVTRYIDMLYIYIYVVKTYPSIDSHSTPPPPPPVLLNQYKCQIISSRAYVTARSCID